MKMTAKFEAEGESFNSCFEQLNSDFNAEFSEGGGGQGGKDGATFIPSVSADGIISWTNDRGLQNPTPVKVRGKDGYTPQKGTDYWTPADKADMVNDVISALPKYNGEVVEV